MSVRATRQRTHAAGVRAALALMALCLAAPAGAHTDWAKESGIVQLDSATAVVGRGASTLNWRSANPLSVPDRFGPGAILSVGNIRMKVINDGTLGNPYTNTSTDPSAQWPGTSGVEYLNAITLAVGAVNPRSADPITKRRVSYFGEWRPPTLDPVDRIYSAFDGVINGSRFVNDDSDVDRADPDTLQKIDEDFHDGHDNDGDGLIDEDYGALGQQEFTYVIRDDTPEAINTVFNEKHVPLGLEVKVHVWAYSLPGLQDFNVAEYTVTNVSGHTLDSLTVGWLVDMDAGPVALSPYWTDDVDFPQYPSGEFNYRVGSQPGDLADPAMKQGGDFPTQYHATPPLLGSYYYPLDSALCAIRPIRVNGFSVADKDGDQGRTPGIGTFMLIDHTLDLRGSNAPGRVGFRSFRSVAGITQFTQGGLPRTDQERFQSMVSRSNISASTGFIRATPGPVQGDYVEWCSIGPFRNLQPGKSVSATIAFGVSKETAAHASGYTTDYQRYQQGVLTGFDLFAKYPALAMALTAQVAFEGIHEYRQGYLETRPINRGGRSFHGRETPIRLPRGAQSQYVSEPCNSETRPFQEDILVTDQQYSWFDFDCDYCTGVWTYFYRGLPNRTGLFHKTWNASSPPTNPATNVSAQYNFTDNPGRRVVAPGDRAVRLAWDNVSDMAVDPSTRWLDFRGYSIWKAADWSRPPGSAGPNESDWLLLGEFRLFDYYTGVNPTDMALEHNYSRDAATGEKICPQQFNPNYFDPVTKLYGKTVAVCLDRLDLWDRQSGEVIKPDWTIPCVPDSSGPPSALEISSGDLEWNVPARVGGSYTHVFPNAGTYPYMCMRHVTQGGAVVVAADGADSATVGISNLATFDPPSVTIRVGGTVRWINRSGTNHVLQTDRDCQAAKGVIVHRLAKTNPLNFDTRLRYPVGRYQYVDREVNNGFNYFYSVTAFDSTTDQSLTTQLGGLRSAFESASVIPQAGVDVNGKHGVWVVPNPYRGYASLGERTSSWDLTPNATDPTGTHVDFMGLPLGPYTIRIYTVSGDLVKEIHSSDAVNESIRRPVAVGGTTLPGYNRQQDNANDGQARWNLISRNGQDIASGIYLFTVEAREGSQTGKFVIIR